MWKRFTTPPHRINTLNFNVKCLLHVRNTFHNVVPQLHFRHTHVRYIRSWPRLWVSLESPCKNRCLFTTKYSVWPTESQNRYPSELDRYTYVLIVHISLYGQAYPIYELPVSIHAYVLNAAAPSPRSSDSKASQKSLIVRAWGFLISVEFYAI